MTKMESVEIRLKQMTDRCDSLVYENKDLTERVSVYDLLVFNRYTLNKQVLRGKNGFT